MPSNRRKTPKKSGRPRLKFYEFIAIMVFLSLVCLLVFIVASGLLYTGDSLGSAQAYALQTQIALNTDPTPTPFLPDGQGGQTDITNNVNPAGTPEAAEPTESEPTPTTRVLQQPEGQVNILLLGSDARPAEGGFRTDVIVLVSLNPKGEFVSAISFPRDLFVNIPGYGNNRINVAFPYGGFDLLADTFELNFGIRPDRYMLVNFSGFKAVVDSLGGINVQAAQNLSDSCATWIDPSGYCSVGPGQVHMNGEVALWYARSRYSTSDIDRARRSQEVIKAIFNRMMNLDAILQAPDMYNIYKSYVETDIGLTDIVPLLPLATKVYGSGDIRSYVIGYNQVYDWITPQGAQVLLPDYGLIQEILIEALQLQ